MANSTFVWTGGHGTTGGSTAGLGGGTTGGSTYGDSHHVTGYNSWNRKENWKNRVAGGQTGNTGGGQTGAVDIWFYEDATRIPSGGDDVILQHLPDKASIGLGNGPWPKSELLYGGVQGGVWKNRAGGTAGTGDIANLFIENSYWTSDGVSTVPYERLRFGTNLEDSPVDGYHGLNLFVDNMVVDSVATTNEQTNDDLRFRLDGHDTHIDEFYMNGMGTYYLRCNYINFFIAEGEQYNLPDSYESSNKSLNMVVFGDIKQLLRVGGKSIDGFIYMPSYGSTNPVNYCAVNPKYINDAEGSIDIRGRVKTSVIYPYSNVNNYDGRSKISFSAFGNQSYEYQQITLEEYNNFWGVVFNENQDNNRLSFNNHFSDDTIKFLKVDAGTFETLNLNSKITIKDGELNVDGTLDFRTKNPSGEIEVAGHTGGVAGEGIFNNAVNSSILLPSGVDVSFAVPAGGQTAALEGGLGSAFVVGARSKG